MKEIKAIELTPENFKDYGVIISKTKSKPWTENEEITYWGKVLELKISEVVSTGILVNNKREPLVNKMERHVSTPEMLVALEGDSIICMARPSCYCRCCSSGIEGIKAFYLRQGDAIVMHAGTWHWASYPVDCEASKILVVFASGTEDKDMEIQELDEEVKLNL